mgnify:CR=1 FL=1
MWGGGGGGEREREGERERDREREREREREKDEKNNENVLLWTHFSVLEIKTEKISSVVNMLFCALCTHGFRVDVFKSIRRQTLVDVRSSHNNVIVFWIYPTTVFTRCERTKVVNNTILVKITGSRKGLD